MAKATRTSSGTSEGAALVDQYLAGVDSPQRETLTALRKTLRSILPYADEGLKYAMPAFILDGKGVAGYDAFKAHCSYFPMSGTVLDRADDAIARYPRSKGGIRFGVDEKLPVGVVRLLVKLRLEEIADVSNGQRRIYYPDGRLKAAGRMKDGQLDGPWEWFRSDGSLMRVGTFANGEHTGTWTTWNRDGTPGTSTQF
ncbi:MAG: hypothetical protein HKO76_03960 [Acidimicrobiia bacterium]|nr:hypothetical protein [Acidimicrobiia bacterium]